MVTSRRARAAPLAPGHPQRSIEVGDIERPIECIRLHRRNYTPVKSWRRISREFLPSPVLAERDEVVGMLRALRDPGPFGPHGRSRVQATLTVHIGCAKGGSSSIQRFLRRNAAELRARGVVVPPAGLEAGAPPRGQQIDFFQRAVVGNRARPIDGLEERLLGLLGSVGGVEAREIVLSAENLCNPVGFERLLEGLQRRFRVRILMYVRRQDDYLESAWQQWYVKEGRSLLAWMIEHVGTVANWYEMVAPWGDAFGDDAVTVRRFDRAHLVGQDVVADFCQYAGIDLTGLQAPKQEANPSYDNRLSAVLEGRPGLFEGPHDHSFYDMLVALAGDSLFKAPGSPRLLSLVEREAIMTRYAGGNEALRARFLPDAEAPLFEPPSPAPSIEASDIAAYERELLQRQIRSLYHRVIALENG